MEIVIFFINIKEIKLFFFFVILILDLEKFRRLFDRIRIK